MAIALGLGTLALSLLAVKLLNPLPTLDGRTISTALLDTADTRIGRSAAALAAGHSGKAGIYTLTNGSDAFAARMLRRALMPVPPAKLTVSVIRASARCGISL